MNLFYINIADHFGDFLVLAESKDEAIQKVLNGEYGKKIQEEVDLWNKSKTINQSPIDYLRRTTSKIPLNNGVSQLLYLGDPNGCVHEDEE